MCIDDENEVNSTERSSQDSHQGSENR